MSPIVLNNLISRREMDRKGLSNKKLFTAASTQVGKISPFPLNPFMQLSDDYRKTLICKRPRENEIECAHQKNEMKSDLPETD